MNPAEILIPRKIKYALDALHQAGYEAYVVGGCVRDTLLGKEPHDWDIATSAAPEEVQSVFGALQQINTGLKHGTVMVVIDREIVEITTFRIDGEYSDGRRPDNVSFTSSIAEDLSRRDFTINACAMTETRLIDPYGGREDARNKLVRCVGSPKLRFAEDALRILRGIRFASALNFKVEEETKAAMLECVKLLKNISQERITVEFCKILLGANVRKVMLEFKYIMTFILPEIKAVIGCQQHNSYHVYDVYEHSLRAVESIENHIILRACMFFHDIAKPSCHTLDENNVGHFYGHPEKSAEMTEKILKRMKFSTADTVAITELVNYHDVQIDTSSKSVKKLLNKLGEVQFRRLIKVKTADVLAQNPELAEVRLQSLAKIEQILNGIISAGDCISMHELAINGKDLLELGIPQGRQIGQILNRLLKMVLEEEVENTRDALLEQVYEKTEKEAEP